MFLKRIVVNNVRNIKEAVLEPEENINLIVGENGSGKTSLLESIDILSRGRSFRSRRIAEVQRKNTNSMAIGGILDNGIKIQVPPFVEDKDEIIKTLPLYASEDLKKVNFFKSLITSINYLIWGDV